MDPKWQAFCFAVALALFLLAAFADRVPATRFVAAGLAAAVVPFLYNAAVAGW